jgi:hypothetical protein
LAFRLTYSGDSGPDGTSRTLCSLDIRQRLQREKPASQVPL